MSVLARCYDHGNQGSMQRLDARDSDYDYIEKILHRQHIEREIHSDYQLYICVASTSNAHSLLIDI